MSDLAAMDLQRLQSQLDRMEAVQRAFQAEIRERLDAIETRLPPAVLTVKQVAALLRVSPRRVKYALDHGALREVKLPGARSRMVDATSIRAVNIKEELERAKLELAAR